MTFSQNNSPNAKFGLHPRNRHNQRYDFEQLIKSCPDLAFFVFKNKYGEESIDFSNPAAVKALNKALLHHFYNISWDIPERYLCPPIPGRADYIHHVADLLEAFHIEKGPSTASKTMDNYTHVQRRQPSSFVGELTYRNHTDTPREL